MLIIFGVTLLLSSTVSCVDQICRFNQTGTCYAALGHKLSLQMVQDTPDLELMLIKQNITNNTDYTVIKIKNNTARDEHESIRNRFEFIMNNGTLIIKNVTREDFGKYTLEIFNSMGSQTHVSDLQVNIKVRSVVPIVLSCVTVILVVLVITVYHIYKKKEWLKSSAEVENDAVGPQRKRKKIKEEEVEYGQMTFTPSNIQQQVKEREECVYSQVHTHTPD